MVQAAVDFDKMIAAYHDSYSVYPAVKDSIDALTWLLKRAQFGSFAPSMLLTGPTGSGKSAFIKYFDESYMAPGELLVTRVRPTLHETLVWLTKELTAYKNHRSKASDTGLIDYAIKSIKKSDLKVLVIEECQELFECTKHDQRQEIRDRLKMISDECHLPIVFVGLPSAKVLLEDSQWQRRIMVQRQFRYITIDGISSLDPYFDLLESLESSIPLKLENGLSDYELAMRLLAASRGMLGMIKELIASALEAALASDSEIIRMQDFSAGYQLFTHRTEVNPFTVEMDLLIVPQIVSYEEYVVSQDKGELTFIEQVFQERTLNELLG